MDVTDANPATDHGLSKLSIMRQRLAESPELVVLITLLTTVAQPMTELRQGAVAMVLALLQDGNPDSGAITDQALPAWLVQLGAGDRALKQSFNAQLPKCFALNRLVSGLRHHPTGIDNRGLICAAKH